MNASGAVPVNDVSKLRSQQVLFEKCESGIIEQIKLVDPKVEEFYKQLLNQRTQHFTKLQNEVKKITQPLHDFRALTTYETYTNINLATLKRDMIILENNIRSLEYKLKQDLESFESAGVELEKDVMAAELKISEWNKPIASLNSFKFNKKLKKGNNLSEEVKEFLDFVDASDGHEGGWTAEDHNLFVRVRKKFTKDPIKCVKILHSLMPDISEEDISSHYDWYNKYCALKKKRNKSIVAWRETKKNANSLSDGDSLKIGIQKKKCGAKTFRNGGQNLLEWKMKKQRKRDEEIDKQKQTDKKLKQQDVAKRSKQLEVKKDVEEWKLAKTVREQTRRLEREIIELQEREIRAARANKLIKEFQSQDDMYIQRKLKFISVRSSSEEPFKNNGSSVGVRDPERLLQPTRQWIARINDANRENFRSDMNLKKIQKLAKPEWRRSID